MALTELYVSSLAAGGGDGSEGSPFTWAEMVTDINAGGKAGNRYNVKDDGTYSRTTTLDTISGSGSSTSPIIIRGYASSITDGYQGRTAGGGLVTTNMPSITYSSGRLNVSGNWLILESLQVSATGVNAGAATIADNDVAVRCVFSNSNTAGSSRGLTATGSRCIVFDNDISFTGASGGGSALNAEALSARIIANRINGGVAPGILIASSAVALFNTVFSGTIPISMQTTSGSPCIVFNTCVSGSGDGIDIVSGTTGLQCIIGNMITDNGGYGVDLNNAAVAAFIAYNRTRDNTSGAINLGTDWVSATSYGEVTTDTGGASTDYVDAGSNDYRLIAASPATSAAQPASASIGALQRDQTGSGGGATSFAYIG